MKKLFAMMLAFIFMLSGCQNDLPSSGDSFSGFEGYSLELTEQELENAMRSGKVELENRPDENICYVTITCKTAIASGELGESMLKILPENGVILENYKSNVIITLQYRNRVCSQSIIFCQLRNFFS